MCERYEKLSVGAGVLEFQLDDLPYPTKEPVPAGFGNPMKT